MSKNNNVNPGQYKVSGRERVDDVARERIKGTRKESARMSLPKRSTGQRKKR
jgi:hypothetical protein